MEKRCGYKRQTMWIWICIVFSMIIIHVKAQASTDLRIAFRADTPYYQFVGDSGEAKGLHVDIMEAIARIKGYEVRYFPFEDINGCIKALKDGKVDAILGLPSFYDGDSSTISTTVEITTVDLCMMASKEFIDKMNRGQPVNYVAAFEQNIISYSLIANMGARLYYVGGSQKEILDVLLSGKAQMMICDKSCMTYILEEKGLLEEDYGVILNYVSTVGYSIAVSKGNDTLLRDLNDGIVSLRLTGEYEAILGKWIKEDKPINVQMILRKTILFASIGSLVVGTYIFLSWRVRRLLEKEVAEKTTEVESKILQLQYESNLRNQIIEYSQNATILCKETGHVSLINAAARKLVGIGSDEVWKGKVEDLPVVNKVLFLAQEKAREDQREDEDVDALVHLRDGSGDRKSYRCRISTAFIGGAANGSLITISDVTDEERKKMEMFEKEKSMALSRLVAGIAHEIKNPLTGIQNFAELIETEKGNPKFWDYFATFVPVEANRISRLIESLMNYAKPSKAQKENVEVSELVDECMYLLKNAVANPKIKISVSVPRELWINVDPDQIKQVLINILLNSLESVEKQIEKGVNATKIYRIAISVTRNNKFITLMIADEGGGISEKDLQRCIEPFYTTKERGTGLGLAISRQFVQENGGTMRIDSIQGVGTTITIEFRSIANDKENTYHR